ncbi:Fe-S cluster biogenesis protein NfuA, 4Fe-4S-binding domain [Halogranum amylolyticum]|uniref:Fe-S cluster biogenesis protein NfuA, 4Fe-4S-binding domain n=1 Tax=Halogranum amylolyticum TaxID=660520 RepID=A0A1H8SPI3_9EURY|nr:NifU family protein [Halogranum amylolyticum]SEO80680.1 Fe-S cluster biogenesis protein NfuA, 4Fe-4S-binding domain [Halogranum amylolyticum]
MSTTSPGESLEARIERFVMRNFPQIQLHGGDAGVDAVDEETGEVWISLTGACSGCGISPMTIQALKRRMLAEFDELSEVHAGTGMWAHDRGDGGSDDETFSDVPF